MNIKQNNRAQNYNRKGEAEKLLELFISINSVNSVVKLLFLE